MQVITEEHYKTSLIQKLCKDNEWSAEFFSLVAWDDYERAISSLPHLYRVSISELSHKFWNTNYQNNKIL